jgi:hypothetical protein
MQILQTYTQAYANSATLTLLNTSLTVSRTFANSDYTDTQTVDLQDAVYKYAEDHGCIGLGFYNTSTNTYNQNQMMYGKLQFIETARLTCPYRTASLKTYSSLYIPSNAKLANGAQSQPDSYTSNSAASGSFLVASPSWAMNELGYGAILYICTPYIGCTLDECTLIYRSTIGAETGNTFVTFINNGVTLDPKTVPDSKSMKTFLGNYLPVTISGANSVAANSTAQYVITANTQANVYLSVSSGTINRLKCKSGKTVTLNTAGLSSGETIEIGAGYKFYPNISTYTITIT